MSEKEKSIEQTNKDLERSESEDSLNFDCDGIEEEVFNQEINENIEQNEKEEGNININVEILVDNSSTTANEDKEESKIHYTNNTISTIIAEESKVPDIESIKNDSKEKNEINNNGDEVNLNNIINTINNSHDSLEKSVPTNDEVTVPINNISNKKENNSKSTNNISEEEKNKLIQEDILKECEQQASKIVYINPIIPKKEELTTENKHILRSEDGPHITMLYKSGFSSRKLINNNNIRQDFLENIVPRPLKLKKGKVMNEDSSLPNVKGFHKPNPLKSYIYRMNQHKDEINERKEKLAQCYLLTLGHSLPLGHESRNYQNRYCTKIRNTFTNNYINATKSKIKQNIEFHHKYIDFDYELPTIISKLPYKSYLDFYNSDSYNPQLRRPEDKKYYFVNNISPIKKTVNSIKIPIIKSNCNVNNNSSMRSKSIVIVENESRNGEINQINSSNHNDFNKIKKFNVFESPIIRIKKNNEKLKRIKDIDKIMNQNKINTFYNSKYVLSS